MDANPKPPRPPIWRRALERPGLAVPALYALSTSIGMLYHWVYYDALGINILHYVDTTDLLMASFRQPVVWLIVFGAIIAVQFDNLMSARFGRRKHGQWIAWYGSPTYRRLNLVVGVVMVVSFIAIWARLAAEQVSSGNGAPFQIVFSEDGSHVDGELIGTSNRFLFLREPTTGANRVHPFEALRSIQPISADVRSTTQAEPAEAAAPLETSPAAGPEPSAPVADPTDH